MSISTTYASLILEQIIKEILEEGTTPTVSEITERYETYLQDNDLDGPLFDYDTYSVAKGEASSAAKMASTNSSIRNDLNALYRHLLTLSEQSMINFDRWQAESSLVEKRLNQLNERVNSLLLVSKDTAGYLNYVYDNFNDLSKVDLSYTTAYVDPGKGLATVRTSTTGITLLDLTNLQEQDIEFNVLTRTNLVSSSQSNKSKRVYAFSDKNNYWQERVIMSKPIPVSVELKVKLSTSAVDISKIEIDLHSASATSAVQVTPLYSTDNFSWQQLPIVNVTASITDKYVFQFPEVSAKYVKFIMTKQGLDSVKNNVYIYEFGADLISFYAEGFTADTGFDLVTQPLYINDAITGTPQQFNKVAMEVCEDIPTDTTIDYYVAASNDSTLPVTSGMWIAIDPTTRTSPVYPTVLDLGALNAVTISGIAVSYDGAAGVSSQYINPAQSFTYIPTITGSTPTTQTVVTSAQRYSFSNENEMILSYQLATSYDIAEGTIQLWRNVRDRASYLEVRDIAHGWGYDEPYYFAAVNVLNPNGITMDVGSKPMIVDGQPSTGIVSFAYGNHLVRVHKDQWKAVDFAGINTLALLKAADDLYPYNQRLLIEGFNYPSGWSTDEERVYMGFDIAAQYLCQQVSVFDLIHNTATDDYSKYAIDYDAEDTGATLGGSGGTKPVSKVFLLKVDASNSDFINERFLLKCKVVDTLYKYLRLKAVFTTQDTSIVPYLSAYRIKLGS